MLWGWRKMFFWYSNIFSQCSWWKLFQNQFFLQTAFLWASPNSEWKRTRNLWPRSLSTVLSSGFLWHKNSPEKSDQIFKSKHWILRVARAVGVVSFWYHWKPRERKYLSIFWVFWPCKNLVFLRSIILWRARMSWTVQRAEWCFTEILFVLVNGDKANADNKEESKADTFTLACALKCKVWMERGVASQVRLWGRSEDDSVFSDLNPFAGALL